MKKILMIMIVILLILNIGFMCIKSNTSRVASEEDENIGLKLVTSSKLTQGAVAIYSLDIMDMKEIKAVVLNSVNTVVGNAFVMENEVYIDTSLLPAGLYKIKVHEEGKFAKAKISDETFSVILVEDKIIEE